MRKKSRVGPTRCASAPGHTLYNYRQIICYRLRHNIFIFRAIFPSDFMHYFLYFINYECYEQWTEFGKLK